MCSLPSHGQQEEAQLEKANPSPAPSTQSHTPFLRLPCPFNNFLPAKSCSTPAHKLDPSWPPGGPGLLWCGPRLPGWPGSQAAVPWAQPSRAAGKHRQFWDSLASITCHPYALLPFFLSQLSVSEMLLFPSLSCCYRPINFLMPSVLDHLHGTLILIAL